MNRIKITIIFLGYVFFSSVFADEWIAPDTYLITDPAELTALGFRPGDTVIRHTGNTSSGTQSQTKNIFGTADTNYTAVDGFDFIAVGDANQKALAQSISLITGFENDALFCFGAGGPIFQRQIHLPHGARILGFEWIAYDNSATRSIQLDLVEQCIPNDPANEITNSLITDNTGPSSAAPGDFARTATGTGTINNRLCTYRVVLDFEFCGDSNVTFNKVVVAWKRQTSPAPASPTFGDVSSSHPFYQPIEAMASSGITGGCGGGNYCPDDAVTRGQFAAFFARALGLHWGDL